jgi:hypothetical protein
VGSATCSWDNGWWDRELDEWEDVDWSEKEGENEFQLLYCVDGRGSVALSDEVEIGGKLAGNLTSRWRSSVSVAAPLSLKRHCLGLDALGNLYRKACLVLGAFYCCRALFVASNSVSGFDVMVETVTELCVREG